MIAEYINASWWIVNNCVEKARDECCKKCGRILSPDEIAITKKLVNRGTTVYYCIDCLAEAFDVERIDIEEKIDYFKKAGCTLFQ